MGDGTVLDDELAISLGLQPGVRLVELGVYGRVILPVDFEFSAGWDAPPLGSIFDLGDGRDDVMLAPVESVLPQGLEDWDVDFFLPAATTAVEVGFSPVTFTGAGRTSVSQFAAEFGEGLESIFLYDVMNQQWVSFIVGAPVRINTLATLDSRTLCSSGPRRPAPSSRSTSSRVAPVQSGR